MLKRGQIFGQASFRREKSDLKIERKKKGESLEREGKSSAKEERRAR